MELLGGRPCVLGAPVPEARLSPTQDQAFRPTVESLMRYMMLHVSKQNKHTLCRIQIFLE